ncbi:MAG: DUF3089 domain-containing protein [Haliscomenobacteraceae bacterium CHB4]|nr:DUF3089 domain-containing protein [Haliscomenobacteraceae bacterium CHB4]
MMCALDFWMLSDSDVQSCFKKMEKTQAQHIFFKKNLNRIGGFAVGFGLIQNFHMNKPLTLWLALLGAACISSCSVRPKKSFDPSLAPAAPDYSRLENWASHPDITDPADRTPCPNLKDEQPGSAVDVFFLYPTTYTGASCDQRHWNAAVDDAKTNKKTDGGTILFQASIFNGAGRVFAPRYRQAHLSVFFRNDDKVSAQKALDLAYADTKAAFEYYLTHWNQGRPFIIASHSQGARHALFLLRELVEGKPLQEQLVAAYLVGWPVKEHYFKQIKPCRTPDETGCYCTWRTWNRDFALKKGFKRDSVVCTNPLTWTTTEHQYAPKTANAGGVVRPFCAIRPHIVDAEVHEGILLASRPKFPGSFFFRRKNYHVGDLNLFYMNVRENAQFRVNAYLRR